MEEKLEKFSKFLSYILRHSNSYIDKFGWCEIKTILELKEELSLQIIKEIVENNDKKRFEVDSNYTKIRAVQGHSVNVELNLKVKIPPIILYHGTKEQFLNSILKKGLQKQNRNYVHLSQDFQTAKQVADRKKGKSIILKIDSKKMFSDNYKFFLSQNNIWLVFEVPPKYITKI